MANLRALKQRISSVKSTKKIMQAMKVVSASKLRKAQHLSQGNEDYFYGWMEFVVSLYLHYPQESKSLFYDDSRGSGQKLIVAISAERGLCGGFNNGICKKVKSQIERYSKEKIRIICIGKKAYDILKHEYSDIIIHYLHDHKMQDAPIVELTQFMLKTLREGRYSACDVVYYEYISALTQELKVFSLKPFNCDKQSIAYGLEHLRHTNVNMQIYEPSDINAMIEQIREQVAFAILYHCILSTYVSEQAARMNAMENATKNATEMIDRVTLLYNRSRQAMITKELIEIISGAESIADGS